jgi:hypothetical protein
MSLTKTSIGLSVAAIALSLASTPAAQAASVTYSGDTSISGTPTFNRPTAPGFEGLDNPSTMLSTRGTAVPYFSQGFTVSTTGIYDVIGTQNFDGLQFLYQTLFNPSAPLTNLVSASDSFPDVGNSGFDDLALTSGTSYFLVTTGFNNPNRRNPSAGSFTNTIVGPGEITLDSSAAVPEPATVAGTIAIGVFGKRLIRKRNLQTQR